jgi:hypothetical protein
VIALEAVVARKIALQRGENRDAQLARVLAHVGEELVHRGSIRGAVVDDEPVLGERDERFARVAVESVGCERLRIGRKTIEQTGDVVRDNQLRVGESVHQEHFAAVSERDTNVEHRLLHMFETYR